MRYMTSTEIRNMKGLEYMNREALKYIEKHGLYYFQIIKEHISNRRLEHSISVANLAYDVALNNHLDNAIKAYVAGLLHDIGKEVLPEKAKELMEKHFKEYLDLPRFSYHQFLGSLIAKEEFEADKDVVEAIKYHATGKANMTVLGRIIYATDKIEPTRNFDSSELIKSCMDDWSQGFIDVLKANKEFLIEKKGSKAIENRLTLDCFKYYLGE